MDPRDQYGNPVRQTDEYGNPVHHTRTMGSYGTQAPTGTVGGAIGAGLGTGHEPAVAVGEHRGLSGMLHRSGSSSSSSSSEDDGHGGRRKKGLKEKIKDKLPGVGGSKDQHLHQHGTAGQHHDPQKKGIMDKIKDKVPGTHTNH